MDTTNDVKGKDNNVRLTENPSPISSTVDTILRIPSTAPLHSVGFVGDGSAVRGKEGKTGWERVTQKGEVSCAVIFYQSNGHFLLLLNCSM